MRLFHTSPKTLLPVRRRRRNQALTPTSAEDDEESDFDDENDNCDSSNKKKIKNDRSRDVQGIRHEAVLDSAIFLSAAKVLIDKVEKALQPMKHANDPFFLSRGFEEYMGEFLLLDLGPLLGQYTIQIDEENKIMLLQSPISGQIVYILSASTNEWVGEEDGHAFEGLLVRDLIRQCNGLPKL